MKRSGIVLFAIASIITLPNTNATGPGKCDWKLHNSQTTYHDCSDSTKDFCIKKDGDAKWKCPSASETTCSTTKGVAVAYKKDYFCCKVGTDKVEDTTASTTCPTTNLRWCGATADGESCKKKYCIRGTAANTAKTKCPGEGDASHDSTCDNTDTEKNLGGGKYCCKSGECPGTAAAATDATTTQAPTTAKAPPASDKKSGASGMEQEMAGLFTTTTAALLLSRLNP